MTDHRPRSRRRLLNFVPLLAMASTSSALNLSQFQVITSNQIPKRCIRAYQSDIEGCTRNDFTNGKQCSVSCVQGLEETADKINEACGDLNVSSGSLLGIVLSGGLVDTLCPGFQATTVTTTVQPGTTKGFTTVPGATTTADTTADTTRTTKATTKATSTTSPDTTATTAPSTTAQSTTNQETSSTSATPDSTSASTSTSSSTDATSVQTTAQSTVTSEPAQTSDDSQDDGPTPFVGGSPFDPAPIRSIGTVICSGYDPRVLIATIFAAIFILR
ncbi:hypothetical protein F4820DRAFT_234438 [Hypoxylon rubiginosum]|uniref:Uncharacterized protein n=1 Tax=Hypoxylon rubiginosum TaxID=110542 RepID=A0ACB9Z6L7_9PEZI|nr:hypothetical protein F4820DRAFT_234438 [Hypoxylon rubiginosum]